MRSEYYEAGDFVLGAYAHDVPESGRLPRSSRWSAAARLPGCAVSLQEGAAPALRRRAEFVVRYAITNLSSEELNTSFGSEFNFSLLAGNAHDRYYDIPGHMLDKRNLASTGETNNVKQVSLVDEWLKLKLSLLFSQPAVLWRAPVETVSQSEAGFERVYQSSMVMPLWRISLGRGRHVGDGDPGEDRMTGNDSERTFDTDGHGRICNIG